MSKMIQVRNVPDRLHRELTRRARARNQTLTDYIIQGVLGREVARPPSEEVFERVAGREAVSLDRPAAALVREGRAEREKPALCDVELASAPRRALRADLLSIERGGAALPDYRDLPITRHGHLGLLSEIVALRTTFPAYDAAYVVLAHRLRAALLTADEPLARAVRAHTGLEALSPS